LDEIEAERRFRAELVKKEDFSELKAIIKELVEVQKRTEISIEKLTDAQKKSDERLTRVEAAIEKLTDAHTRFERTFEPGADKLASLFGMEICTNVNELE